MPCNPLVLFRVEVRIAEMTAGRAVVGSAIAVLTDAVPARRGIWRKGAVAAPSPAGALKTRNRITSRPCRGRGESKTYAKPAWAVTKANIRGVALAVPVRAESGTQQARNQRNCAPCEEASFEDAASSKDRCAQMQQATK